MTYNSYLTHRGIAMCQSGIQTTCLSTIGIIFNKTEKILSRPLSLIDLRFEDKLIVKTLDNLPDTSIGTQEDKK